MTGQLAPNKLKATCLRPLPERFDECMALFARRNEVFELQGSVQEAMIEAAARNDQAARATMAERLEKLKLEEEALSRQMRPMQYVAWEREDPNLVTSLGRNDILDKYWRSSGYTQTVVMGLKGTGTAAAADTQASHAGWLEVGGANAPTYSGNRKAVTMGAASSQSSVSPQQTYAMTSSGDVAGLFINNGGSSTKDSTTGVLVAAVDYSTGTETVSNGDSLLVTYTFNG